MEDGDGQCRWTGVEVDLSYVCCEGRFRAAMDLRPVRRSGREPMRERRPVPIEGDGNL